MTISKDIPARESCARRPCRPSDSRSPSETGLSRTREGPLIGEEADIGPEDVVPAEKTDETSIALSKFMPVREAGNSLL